MENIVIIYRVDVVKNDTAMYLHGMHDFKPLLYQTEEEALKWISEHGIFFYTITKVYSMIKQ